MNKIDKERIPYEEESREMKRVKNVEPLPEDRSVKKKRKELIKTTKDKILNIKRASANGRMECIICGNKIKKNQPFRELPRDRNCQEVRHYHLRTCGPGSDNWEAFKANGKKAPKRLAPRQLSFIWKEAKR